MAPLITNFGTTRRWGRPVSPKAQPKYFAGKRQAIPSTGGSLCVPRSRSECFAGEKNLLPLLEIHFLTLY